MGTFWGSGPFDSGKSHEGECFETLSFGYVPRTPGSCFLGRFGLKRESFRWTPHPVIVTIGDNRDYMGDLLYSYYTTITGWGVLPRNPDDSFFSAIRGEGILNNTMLLDFP